MTISPPASPGCYEYAAGKYHIDGGLGLGLALRHDDAFAGGQPIGFHNDRRAVRTDMGLGGSRVFEAGIGRGRDAVGPAKILRETLRAFERERPRDVGPNALMPALSRSSTIPAQSGASGPTTTRSTRCSRQNAMTAA